jgi:redox-regulated HSP33 family molecular chaperone
VSELHKFLFEGLPVRGMLVRLTDSWQEILRRRQQAGGYPEAVTELLGEMAAAATLMQANIKFNGALILQVQGDGPVKLAVAEVQPDLALRATATVTGEVATDAPLSHMVNVNNLGRCAITLDPKDRLPGQQPYQGVVPLFGDRHEKLEKLSEVIEHYMLQSEQLDTRLVLAANDQVAAGLLIQRLPLQGESNLSGAGAVARDEDQIGRNEDYNRIAILAASLKREELAPTVHVLPAPARASAWRACSSRWGARRSSPSSPSKDRWRWAAISVVPSTTSIRSTQRRCSCRRRPSRPSRAARTEPLLQSIEHIVAGAHGVVVDLAGRALFVAVLAVVGRQDAPPGAVFVVHEVAP